MSNSYRNIKNIAIIGILALVSCLGLHGQNNIVDEVVWMVGDEPILHSDVEYQKIRMLSEGVRMEEDPDCFIPEQLAVQMLFLNQAKIDSITVDESSITRYVEADLQGMIGQIGSKEKLEEYFGKNLSQIREDRRRMVRNNEIVRSMQQKIASNLSVSPSEIRNFYNSLPADSIPFVPTLVEVQKISRTPSISLSEIDRIKERLRSFSADINEGKSTFSSLARLYSQDNRTAAQGGEYGFVPKTSLETEFARVVFDLSDTKRVSQVIKTEEGYHIVQLIEKRGDLINFRHILLRPEVANEALEKEVMKLDSIGTLITKSDISFEKAVDEYSQDEKTINNNGLLINENYQSNLSGSSLFSMEDLPQDISRQVANLRIGEISRPFIMINDKGNKEVVLIKLKNRNEAHRANLQVDFQTIKAMALESKRNKVLDEWVRTQQKKTFIEVKEKYRNCNFRYSGWIHDNK
ncbi:peptidylprolyl isomerase [Porphyromonas circumdentaria]|uniref:Periplasmic chaperone for outer membrane proteins SurA n=2 Tax=Porphyromonas TaxID=836 RepID=A0A1T4PFG1_9PORP|nr:peptidylprolyl isomerase [Porphyromonas circumdentaria]MBB6275699.1 peptidyl-prolyl cis-trans isomerase SurA [Porphyromonas circumdentaria]MDO4723036.1 peptidylprolyl isomerase [Porphyromonas circumdentaria]SJZ90067.1 periplasmic chaperone for outer membrane proteins SurA [Porphyromonas circumdentaria]